MAKCVLAEYDCCKLHMKQRLWLASLVVMLTLTCFILKAAEKAKDTATRNGGAGATPAAMAGPTCVNSRAGG